MSKHVVVVASGETERRSLPRLLAGFSRDAHLKLDVRVPAGGADLRADVVEKIVKSAWFENPYERPEKFVVLLDVDARAPGDVVEELRNALRRRVASIEATILYAYAQQHLEAWYFADSESLRRYLGRSEGSVDASAPDEIQDPKRHLMNLLGEQVYTAIVSEKIAAALDPATIEQRSPSFRKFAAAVRNGNGAAE